jgi:hypothetical protein
VVKEMYTYGAERNIQINVEDSSSPEKAGRGGQIVDANVFGSYTFSAE